MGAVGREEDIATSRVGAGGLGVGLQEEEGLGGGGKAAGGEDTGGRKMKSLAVLCRK